METYLFAIQAPWDADFWKCLLLAAVELHKVFPPISFKDDFPVSTINYVSAYLR